MIMKKSPDLWGTRWGEPYALENTDNEVKWLWKTVVWKGYKNLEFQEILPWTVDGCEQWNLEREEFPVTHLALSTCLICLIILWPPESTLFSAFIAKHAFPCNTAVPNEMKCN